jgi:hypothetical protein
MKTKNVKSTNGAGSLHALLGVDLIRAERERQSSGEGWSAEHDDSHRSGELCDAAISYARAAAKQARGESHAYLKEMAAAGAVPWPWEDGWWKPDADQVRNLVKAGALIAAEIDRLLRERRETPNGEVSEPAASGQ